MEIDPNSIAVCTTTFYPKWFMERDTVPSLLAKGDRGLAEHKIRGELAMQTATDVLRQGYQLILVDGAQGSDFQRAMAATDIPFIQEEGRGMSASRRQAFNEAYSRPDVQACVWIEPEKTDMVNHIPECVAPILSSDTEMVVPARKEQGWDSLPTYQGVSEMFGNRIFNEKLHRSGLLPEEEELDVYFGPRVYSAKESVRETMLELINRQYSFDKKNDDVHAAVNPGSYSEATFFPVAAALNEDLSVKSVPVNFKYPFDQKTLEEFPAFAEGENGYAQKRKRQLTGILTELVNYLRSIGKLSGKNRLNRKPTE